MNKSRLVILLAHGSSDPHWLRPFIELAAALQRDEPNTRLAFMELADPSLEQVVAEASQAGYGEALVLPLFLAAGRHLRQDIPRRIDALRQQFGIQITQLPPIGEHPALAATILEILREALRAPQGV